MKSIVTGMLSLFSGIALVALSLSVVAPPREAIAGLDTNTPNPTATPDPTFDPCEDSQKPPSTCTATTVATQPPRSETTNTATPSLTPEATNTSPPAGATNTAAPAPATATPGGGAGAGGVSPPDTGAGAGQSGTSIPWYAAAGSAMALLGLVLVSYGAWRRR